MQSRAIVLIGPMGVGKTTIGRKLAKSLKLDFIDTDTTVVRSHGPIEKLFASLGEAKFRELETDALRQALDAAPCVIATGGGVVTTSANLDLLQKAVVFYLATDGRHIGNRLRNGNRPLIQNGMEDWNRIYEQRRLLYEQAANHIIDTSGVPLSTTVSDIKEKLAI